MSRRCVEDVSVEAARTRIQGEAAAGVALFLRQEFGLETGDAEAALRDGVLTVRLRCALTPMGLLIARAEDGGQVLQGVYDVLYEAQRERLHALVALIAGLPVRSSRIGVDAAAEDISVHFELCRDLGEWDTAPSRRPLHF